MAAPICEICGRTAWPNQSWMHKGCEVANASPQVDNNDTEVANIVAKGDRQVANKHGQYADKEKRRKYMREYMAKKRLTAKAG